MTDLELTPRKCRKSNRMEWLVEQRLAGYAVSVCFNCGLYYTRYRIENHSFVWYPIRCLECQVASPMVAPDCRVVAEEMLKQAIKDGGYRERRCKHRNTNAGQGLAGEAAPS